MADTGLKAVTPIVPEPIRRPRLEVPEAGFAQEGEQHPLTRAVLGTGARAGIQAHATALRQSSGGQLHRAGAALLQLQRDYGNRHVQRLVNHLRRAPNAAPILQRKLTLGPANDQYEREADRASRKVVSERVGHSDGRHEGVERRPGLRRVYGAGMGGGLRLNQATLVRMEQAFGADLRLVRVHIGPDVDQLNDAFQSRAFTIGPDLYFRRSEYRPGTAEGDELVAHELTHTLQQGGSALRQRGDAPPVQVRGQIPADRISRNTRKMHLDFVLMKRQEVDFKGIIARTLGIDRQQPRGGTFGHWWTELGDFRSGQWKARESYGWWPATPVASDLAEVWKGVPGLLNHQGSHSTHDPHEGDDATLEFHPVMKVATTGIDYPAVKEHVGRNIRGFAQNYQGSWNWQLGWGKNCHSFQEAMMQRVGLQIGKSGYWLRDPWIVAMERNKAARIERTRATQERIVQRYKVPSGRLLEGWQWDGTHMQRLGGFLRDGTSVDATGNTMAYDWGSGAVKMVEFVVGSKRLWTEEDVWQRIFDAYPAVPTAEETAYIGGRKAPRR